ncbi:hypothetical protein ACVW2L_002180 [Mucilaginibacter sp. HD30]
MSTTNTMQETISLEEVIKEGRSPVVNPNTYMICKKD